MFSSKPRNRKTVCKCCGQPAYLFDVCDFNKNCEEQNGKFLELSGIPIYYYKCSDCGFIFTDEFDGWSHDDFKLIIYNDGYIDVDPDCVSVRPKANAKLISRIFPDVRSELGILDYGGGNGALCHELNGAGFKNTLTYDPFHKSFSIKPTGQFNLVTAFEVVEHVPDPNGCFEEMVSLVDDANGLLMFSTLIQPPQIDTVKAGWLYIAPRNGHISIHTKKSIHAVLSKFGFHFSSANENLHFAFKNVPAFARHLFN